MTDTVQPEWMQNYVPPPPRGPGNPAWVKGGPSPNPAGKPKGATDKRAKLTRQLLEGAGGIVDTMIAKALEGDSAAAALVLNRVLPALRSNSLTVQFTFDASLPIAGQVEQVLAAVAAGEVPPDTGQQIIAMIRDLATVRATEDLENRLAMLEAKQI